METHDLIKQLAHGGTPVSPLMSPAKRFGFWSTLAILFVVSGMYALNLHVRHDIAYQFSDIHFWVEGGLVFSLAILSAMTAFLLSVPGEENAPWQRWAPIAVVGLWLAALGWRTYDQPFSWQLVELNLTQGSHCAQMMLWLSIAPTLLFVWMVKRAAPIRRGWTGMLGLLSVGAFTSLACQFFCHGSNSFHILFWHFSPLLLLGGAGMLIGKSLLRWTIRK